MSKYTIAINITANAHSKLLTLRGGKSRYPLARFFHKHYIDNRTPQLIKDEGWAFDRSYYEPRSYKTYITIEGKQINEVLDLALEHNIKLKENKGFVTNLLGQFLDAVIKGRLIPEAGYPVLEPYKPTREPTALWKKGLDYERPSKAKHRSNIRIFNPVVYIASNSVTEVLIAGFSDESVGDIGQYRNLTEEQLTAFYSAFDEPALIKQEVERESTFR